MKNLIKKLTEFKNKYPIENEFNWTLPSNIPILIPSEIKSNFDKNIYLKENLSKLLENDTDLKNHYWIIQDWGGIKSLKKNERNDKKIITFKNQLQKGILTKDTFGTISSLSKIASFIYPEKYVIYDSRVIFTLNWLLFNYTEDKKLFPQPSSRNKELVKYDMNTIFNLTGKKYSYYNHKEAYHIYCNLICELSKDIYPNEKPYYLEILLFCLAPEVIVNNIRDSVDIKIKL